MARDVFLGATACPSSGKQCSSGWDVESVFRQWEDTATKNSSSAGSPDPASRPKVPHTNKRTENHFNPGTRFVTG